VTARTYGERKQAEISVDGDTTSSVIVCLMQKPAHAAIIGSRTSRSAPP